MEHVVQQPSDVCDLMPCELGWSQQTSNVWAFWSIEQNDELDYLRSIKSINSYSVVSIFPTDKWRIQSVMEKMSTLYICLVQLWAPIKVNGSTFLSTADQPFAFYNEIDKRLCSYRKLCLDTLIPIDKETPFGPPARVFSRRLPEYNYDVRSYSSVEFPLLQTAIRLGIHSYYAFPVFNLHDQQCLGVFEIVSTQPSLHLPNLIKGLNFESVGLYIPNSINILFERPQLEDERLGDIEDRLHEILGRLILPFAQIWIPFSLPSSLKVLYCAGAFINTHPSSMFNELEVSSEVCCIESGKALVGRAFASQGSCFCKDVTLLSINEYPVLPGARKGRLTHSFAICLQSKCANKSVYVVEYLMRHNEMFLRDTKTFLNMLLSTMKQLLPGFIVAPGKELGQRMLVEVVKVSPSDELDSFEIDSHFEQPNLETNSAGNATTNNEIIHLHKKKAIQRIVKDHGITRKILEQHYGMTLKDAAEDLYVSRATLKRICREYEIARWPHHKTRKVNVHVSQGVSFQGAEPYVVDQQCPALSQDKGTDYLGHKISPATGKPCDKVMTLKVTYRGDIIKFQLTFSSTRVELEGEVVKRLKISLERFSIKYEDEDDDWILITTDSDLRDGMHSLRLLGRTTMRLLVTPEADS